MPDTEQSFWEKLKATAKAVMNDPEYRKSVYKDMASPEAQEQMSRANLIMGPLGPHAAGAAYTYLQPHVAAAIQKLSAPPPAQAPEPEQPRELDTMKYPPEWASSPAYDPDRAIISPTPTVIAVEPNEDAVHMSQAAAKRNARNGY